MSEAFGPKSQLAYCSGCQQSVQTHVIMKSSTRTHIIALLLCVFGCCPCAACMYCTDCARNAEHFCPHCKKYMGAYCR